MALVDARTIPQQTRLAAADQIRTATDFTLPELDWFNSQPCARHATLEEGIAQYPSPCRHCGVRLRKHQRVGAAWLYMRGRGLVADQMGSGKTAQAAGLLAMMKQTGELGDTRALIVVRPAVLRQWQDELTRFVPGLLVSTATKDRKTRIERYLGTWEVMITGYQILCKDLEVLDNFPINTVIADDIDPLRNPSTTTAYAIKRLGRRCDRAVVLTGTPLQKRLHELHSILEMVGGLELLGSAPAFRRRYVREEMVKLYSPNAGRMVNTKKTIGYQNIDEFKAKIQPLTLRRTSADIDDVELPAVTPSTVYLDLYPPQRARYDELRRGVLKMMKTDAVRIKQVEAAAKFVYGAQICSGLATLGEPDRPNTSVKLDWVERALVDGDLSEEKVVVFAQFTNTIEALSKRLDAAGVRHVIIWGRDQDKQHRQDAKNAFWDDPNCRVLLGTSAIEQGLNLQVARHLINIDQLMNPARMQQLAGRIRRDGSAHHTVYVHNLLTHGTQEEGYMDLLTLEQALADHVWDEANDLYEALHPLALLQLIGRSGR